MLATTAPLPAVRDEVDALIDRMARLDALRVQVSAIADDLRGMERSAALADALATLERDLTLTARSAGRLCRRVQGGTP